MADKVEFELVSPEKLLVSQPVDMVVVPGSEGNFGVLAGHAPFISTIRPGVIDIFEGDRIIDRIFIAGGFAEVTETRCTVLAEQATNLSGPRHGRAGDQGPGRGCGRRQVRRRARFRRGPTRRRSRQAGSDHRSHGALISDTIFSIDAETL
jgi:ATP synthase F1 epsilon subunit